MKGLAVRLARMGMAAALRPASTQLVRAHRAAWASRTPGWKLLERSAGAQRAYRATPVVAAASHGKQLQVSHILVPADQEALINDLKQRIQGGESFAELAQAHSQCPSGKRGGDLGWISMGRTVPEFEQAAFSAAPGELVKVKSPFGWHLLTVLKEAADVVPMSVQDLAEKLAAASVSDDLDTQFVDVREEGELRMAKLPHFVPLPLSRFEEWGPRITQVLDPSKETVVLCHHGVRSMQMAQFLIGQGFQDVKNVTGGIDAYSRGVDFSVPQY